MENTKANVLSLAAIVAVVMVMSTAEATVPAVFVLGDSTVDVGTNNFLSGSVDRADFPHNGIDFPGSKATGRFGNGLNIADFLAKQLGLEMSPPPFFMLGNGTFPLKNSSFKGVNFASGGAGILDTTGLSPDGVKQVVPLSEQVHQLSSISTRLASFKGAESAADYLATSMFIVSMGSNDIFHYYHFNSSSTKEQFLTNLTATYEQHLRTMIGFGVRKIGIIAVGPIGCCPSQRTFNETLGCLGVINDLANSFNSRLRFLMSKLSSEYDGMKYSVGDAYSMTMSLIKNPASYGFKEVNTACCGTGKLNAEFFCTPDANICSNREQTLFWDMYHPTQAASKLAASTLYNGGRPFVAPINFKQLAAAF
ncbi:GDSL esterase/lipase At5g55050 [Linum perenne]